MRSVLAILGIAVVAIIVSIVVQGSKKLSPSPQDDAARIKEAEQQAAWKKADSAQRAQERGQMRDFNPPREGVRVVVMAVAGKGEMTFELYPKAAPKTVEHFLKLATSGFYSGVKFHRVEKGFVVQAGDPETRQMSTAELAGISDQQKAALGIGAGGSGSPIPFETNALSHIRGSLAMALNSPRSATGDSQFFVNLKDNVGLNGDYCVFGKVVKGLEVVDKIAQGDAITGIEVQAGGQ